MPPPLLLLLLLLLLIALLFRDARSSPLPRPRWRMLPLCTHGDVDDDDAAAAVADAERALPPASRSMSSWSSIPPRAYPATAFPFPRRISSRSWGVIHRSRPGLSEQKANQKTDAAAPIEKKVSDAPATEKIDVEPRATLPTIQKIYAPNVCPSPIVYKEPATTAIVKAKDLEIVQDEEPGIFALPKNLLPKLAKN